MAPDAPGWLMMTMVWPSDFASSEAVTRVTVSVEPPAAQGTIRLIGRDGFHAAPCARARIAETPRTPAARPMNERRLGRKSYPVESDPVVCMTFLHKDGHSPSP